MRNSIEHSDRGALGSLAVGATLVSLAPVFVKLLSGLGMGPSAIGLWRTLLGAAVLFAWAAMARMGLWLPWRIMRWSLAAGFMFFLDLYFWHKSIVYTGAGMATILANTQVFATAILGFLIFRERLSPRFFAAAVAGMIGVALLIGIGSEIEFTATYINGVLYGLATGLVYAHYIIFLKMAGHEQGSTPVRGGGFVGLMAWTSLFSAFFLAVTTVLVEPDQIFPADINSWLTALALAVVVQALGWWVISRVLPRLVASRSALALLLQPVLATIWGALLFAERLTVLQILGAVVTLIAIYVGSVRGRARQTIPSP